MTLRELLAQHSIDLDQQIERGEISMNRPVGAEYAAPGGYLIREPGPLVEVTIQLTIAAEKFKR